jgi:hypothetical protein
MALLSSALGSGETLYVLDSGSILVINVLLALVGAIIVERKGYGWSDRLIYLVFGLFCWPLAILAAISKPNLNIQKLEQAQREIQNRQNHQAWKEHQRLERMEQELKELRAKSLPPESASLSAAQPGFGLEALTKSAPASSADSAPATATNSGLEIKVRCRSCGKKFGGAARQISILKSCPRCGVTPFEYVFVG